MTDTRLKTDQIINLKQYYYVYYGDLIFKNNKWVINKKKLSLETEFSAIANNKAKNLSKIWDWVIVKCGLKNSYWKGKIIYHFQKDRHYTYAMNWDCWELVKQYSGIYKDKLPYLKLFKNIKMNDKRQLYFGMMYPYLDKNNIPLTKEIVEKGNGNFYKLSHIFKNKNIRTPTRVDFKLINYLCSTEKLANLQNTITHTQQIILLMNFRQQRKVIIDTDNKNYSMDRMLFNDDPANVIEYNETTGQHLLTSFVKEIYGFKNDDRMVLNVKQHLIIDYILGMVIIKEQGYLEKVYLFIKSNYQPDLYNRFPFKHKQTTNNFYMCEDTIDEGIKDFYINDNYKILDDFTIPINRFKYNVRVMCYWSSSYTQQNKDIINEYKQSPNPNIKIINKLK